MNERQVRETTVDFCPRCAGVFVDADESEAVGADLTMVFGLDARAAGTSTRICPDHATAMMLFDVSGPYGPITLDRAPCCGGVFFDAGEAASLARASDSLALPATTKSCPICRDTLTTTKLHEIDVDECVRCGHIFFDASEPERAGIDTVALFADAPWGATPVGENAPCPLGHGNMVHYRKEVMGGVAEVDFAPCCKGVWMAKDAVAIVKRAGRVCVTERADSQYARGEVVEHTLAQRTPEEALRDAALKERRIVLAHVHTLQNIERAASDMQYRRRWPSRVRGL